VLRASEIASYAYCARGWWLTRVLGYPSAHTKKMALGEENHVSHGRRMVSILRLEKLGYLLMAVGGFLGLMGLIWWMATRWTG